MDRQKVVIDNLKDSYGPMLDSVSRVAEIETGGVKHYNFIVFANTARKFPEYGTKYKVGWWMNDLRHPKDIGKINRKIDAVFLCNKQYLLDYESYYKIPTFYVPQCGLTPQNKSGRKMEAPVVFIGSVLTNQYHANRWTIIEHIKKEFDVDVIFGERNTSDQDHIYKNTPISLAISPQAYGYTSNRLYNILASGGFCLTLYFPGIEDLFENKKHLVWFKTKEEALELAKYYINNPKEIDKIAKQGHQEYLKKHTAKHRLDYMFNILETL